MRTALGRARRLVTLLFLALSAWYLFLRRRAVPVRSPGQPDTGPAVAGRADRDSLGAPGELPDDVLATDAGLTELPDAADGSPAEPAGIVVVDEVRVGQVLVEGQTGEPEIVEIVEETITLAAIPGPDDAGTAAPTDREVAGSAAPTDHEVAEDGIEDPTNEFPRPEFAETPSPAFSEAPTMEMPVLMDDLRAVRGIGPSMERMLHGLGIVSFRQLALLDGAELERVRHELRDFRSRIEREDWIGQARQLHKGKYGTDPA